MQEKIMKKVRSIWCIWNEHIFILFTKCSIIVSKVVKAKKKLRKKATYGPNVFWRIMCGFIIQMDFAFEVLYECIEGFVCWTCLYIYIYITICHQKDIGGIICFELVKIV